jgi:cytochrome c biogenesis protein CcdA
MSAQEKQGNATPHGARLVFGIFMIIIYVGVGVLCILDIFNFDNAPISLALGILLIVYGIWRAIRLYKGWN